MGPSEQMKAIAAEYGRAAQKAAQRGCERIARTLHDQRQGYEKLAGAWEAALSRRPGH